MRSIKALKAKTRSHAWLLLELNVMYVAGKLWDDALKDYTKGACTIYSRLMHRYAATYLDRLGVVQEDAQLSREHVGGYWLRVGKYRHAVSLEELTDGEEQGDPQPPQIKMVDNIIEVVVLPFSPPSSQPWTFQLSSFLLMRSPLFILGVLPVFSPYILSIRCSHFVLNCDKVLLVSGAIAAWLLTVRPSFEEWELVLISVMRYKWGAALSIISNCGSFVR